MQTVNDITSIRTQIAQWRHQEQSIAFVPTMGNLHEGHLELIRQARLVANKTVVSIFVNPAQFGVGEDFECYPRTEDLDRLKLQQAGVDLLFLPQVNEIYPSLGYLTHIHVQGMADMLCGQSRPGHFDGVALVVCKLFNIVQPDHAFFGEKDFQQLQIIRALVRDLNFAVSIQSIPIQRDVDGLALSSRNQYLTADERCIAPLLYATLIQVREAILHSERPLQNILADHLATLSQRGFEVDYLVLCRVEDLSQVDNRTDAVGSLVILAAARLGKTRLIDNIQFHMDKIKA